MRRRRDGEDWGDYAWRMYPLVLLAGAAVIATVAVIMVLVVMPILILLGIDVQIGCNGTC